MSDLNLDDFKRRFDQEVKGKADSVPAHVPADRRVEAAMDVAMIMAELREHLEDLLIGRAMPRATADDIPFLQASAPSTLANAEAQEIEQIRRQRQFMHTPLAKTMAGLEDEIKAFIRDRFELEVLVMAAPNYDTMSINFRISFDGSTWHSMG